MQQKAGKKSELLAEKQREADAALKAIAQSMTVINFFFFLTPLLWLAALATKSFPFDSILCLKLTEATSFSAAQASRSLGRL